ncbi:MAG: hypothetical protein QOD06_3494 [Candidatus Binatota bacterium]|jgi:hypothetical protein|nr:hypothetical protein [Candidatus Binatota bacterium]
MSGIGVALAFLACVTIDARPPGGDSLVALLSDGLVIEDVKTGGGFARALVRFENRTGKTLQGTVIRCFAIGPGGTEIGSEERSVSTDATLRPGYVGHVEVPVALKGADPRLFSCKARTAVLD